MARYYPVSVTPGISEQGCGRTLVGSCVAGYQWVGCDRILVGGHVVGH